MIDLQEVTLLIGFGTLIVTRVMDLLNRRQDAMDRAQEAALAAQRHDETSKSIETVRQDVNGKMQQVIDVTGAAREEKGHREGIAEEHERNAS